VGQLKRRLLLQNLLQRMFSDLLKRKLEAEGDKLAPVKPETLTKGILEGGKNYISPKARGIGPSLIERAIAVNRERAQHHDP
jgi:hypothetical protein